MGHGSRRDGPIGAGAATELNASKAKSESEHQCRTNHRGNETLVSLRPGLIDLVSRSGPETGFTPEPAMSSVVNVGIDMCHEPTEALTKLPRRHPVPKTASRRGSLEVPRCH